MYDDSNCSTSSPILVINWHFDYSHPSGWGGIFLWFLICISLMTNDVGHLFMCRFLTVYLLWRNVCSSPLSIFNWAIWSFHCSIMSCYIFWTLDPYQMYDLEILSPILRDVFSSKRLFFFFKNFGDYNTYFSLVAYVFGLSNRPYLISNGLPWWLNW